ncbi:MULTISPECIES: hypothetical protein [unclassified Paenibacillus]|uniref:Uncharacterized protein n=2 Tax=Bacillati TaxID=1783272 RepID=A0ABW3Q3B7_9BACL|nr:MULTISPECIES: hypothetical protein [unclassified Paenibacillus]MCM3130192.1 hypothetical protein [Paenibacillus sp. MER 78]SDX71411.1 hypothetical protein SAMN05518848_11284 [Paenibacillus sp. PDC88]SFS88705.1 hypothetical protein SAMN04488601_10680 [Paenibacillus sp. 453mf]
MSSNKHFTKGNSDTKGNIGISEIVSKPVNNNELAEQLKAAILGECFPADMSKNMGGCLKFSVRGGQLAINHILLERELSPKVLELKATDSETKTVVGMKRSGLKTLLMILDAVIKEEDPIDHATVFVYYSVADNGEFASGKLVVERGIHHPRY